MVCPLQVNIFEKYEITKRNQLIIAKVINPKVISFFFQGLYPLEQPW